MTQAQLHSAAIDRVSESQVGWLTTIRPDGSPHTTPVWFVFTHPIISIATGLSNIKVRNIEGDARVSFAIDGSASAPLVAEGIAELIGMREANLRTADAFAKKYNGWDVRDETVDGGRVIVEIRVVRWLLRG